MVDKKRAVQYKLKATCCKQKNILFSIVTLRNCHDNIPRAEKDLNKRLYAYVGEATHNDIIEDDIKEYKPSRTWT